MKRKISKRVWAVTLIAILLVSVFPIAGLAEDEPLLPSPTGTVETSNLEEPEVSPSPSNSVVPQNEEPVPSDTSTNTVEPEPSPSMEPTNALPSTENTVLAEPQSTSDFTIQPDGTITAYNGAGGDVVIPETIDGITVTAFSGYVFSQANVTSIVIPKSVNTIPTYVFSYCKTLQSIEVSEDNPTFSSQEGILFNKDKTTLIRMPEGSKISNYTVPDSVRNIGNSAFADCDNLITVVIPDSVNNIGGAAFYVCDNLSNVVLPSGLKTLEDWTFLFCYSLTSIELPDGLTHIGTSALGCPLTQLVVPASVTSIDVEAFHMGDSDLALEWCMFLGNAPETADQYLFDYVASDDFKIYYYPSATGFDQFPWTKWNCYPLSSEETKEVQIDTLPQEQQTAAQSKVMAAIGIPSLNENQKLTYYDIQLVNPVTGEVYTKDNFPSEGIDVLIPYPDGMTKDNNTYRLFHFPNGVDDEMVEVTPLVLTDAGIQFHVDSLSPFALLSEQVTQSTTVTGTTTVNDTTKPPKTGDSSMDITFLVFLTIVAGSACAATVIYRKHHHKA